MNIKILDEGQSLTRDNIWLTPKTTKKSVKGENQKEFSSKIYVCMIKIHTHNYQISETMTSQIYTQDGQELK